MPFTTYPDIFKPATLAYNNSTSYALKSTITSPSSDQTVDPIATPYIRVLTPGSVISLKFDLVTNATAGHAYKWIVEFKPSGTINNINFAVALPATGTSVVFDGGSYNAPTLSTGFAIYEFYTVDGVNIKGRTVAYA